MNYDRIIAFLIILRADLEKLNSPTLNIDERITILNRINLGISNIEKDIEAGIIKKYYG